MKRWIVLLAVWGQTVLGASAVLGAIEWKEVGELRVPRSEHTATLLPSGQILIAGGLLDISLLSAELYNLSTGQWSDTGDLATARSNHTATLLPSGQVLVVGGEDSSAELYNPSTGKWSDTGALAIARSNHTATLLPSGQVLVSGGATGVTTELWDPSTGQWSSTGALATARYLHTATLLPSGKVLLTGGEDFIFGQNDGPLASAELYDPSTGQWSDTGTLATARSEHTATLLPSGGVLVAGGLDSNSLSSAELYDPSTGQWSGTDRLATARSRHTATLLPSGKVLVTGGLNNGPLASAEIYDPDTGKWGGKGALLGERTAHTATLLPTGQVLVIGGTKDGSLASAEIHDPSTGQWSTTGSLATPRFGHTATVLPSGKVLVAGGLYGNGGGGDALSSAELYDPSTGQWSPTGSLATERYLHTATLLPSGQVLVAGGSNDGGALASVEIYDPSSGQWSSMGTLATARYGHTATLLPSGQVLVAGGYNGLAPFPIYGCYTVDICLSSAELYEPSTGQWSSTGALVTARYYHTATLLPSGQVLAAGGSNDDKLSSAEIYDPNTRQWSNTGTLARAVLFHRATLLPSGQALVVGGVSDAVLPNAETYDPSTHRWSRTGALAMSRLALTATLLPSGQVLVVGGVTSGTSFLLASAEIYDPSTGQWSSAGSLTTARYHHTATLLPSGQVLVVGGIEHAALSSAELYTITSPPAARMPVIQSTSSPLRFGEPFSITGNFRNDSEASSGNTQNSAVNYPLIHLRNFDGTEHHWLIPDPGANFWVDPVTLTVSDLPVSLNAGPHYLRVIVAGVPSDPVLVEMECSVGITTNPLTINPAGPVDINDPESPATVTFTAPTQGARRYQWLKDGADIPNTNSPTYTTPQITAADVGTTYQIHVESNCASATSDSATIQVIDTISPTAEILTPSGGEYWPLSAPGEPLNEELIAWTTTDNIRICQTELSLLYSNDGGTTYEEAPPGNGLPITFGNGGACKHIDRVEIASTSFTIPTAPPSGTPGSLYKIRLRTTDHAGNTTETHSATPFYIVEPSPDSVKTLILTNLPRMAAKMGITPVQRAALHVNLQDLANHPRVQGLLVDLSTLTATTGLYTAWDADPSNPARANQVLFGCHPPYPPGCTTERDGIHDLLRDLLRAYSGVESIVLVGDDRIIPLTRIQDRTTLFPEQRYPEPDLADLTPDGTTVGQALAANKYLSDDPLATLDPVLPDDLSGKVFIPNLAIGRLVETPEEIITTIATYISNDGVLELSPPAHKVQVTGYDFLTDSATRIRKRWQTVLQQTNPEALTPVDGQLIGQDWDEIDLLQHLCGNGGPPYGLISLNGHAVHYAEGIPGSDPFDIHGLDTQNLLDPQACGVDPLDLSGRVVYAVGCHGGLPVPGSDPFDADHSLDLPQAFLARGAVAYIANSGYGWGLRHGIGYGERLVELFTEEMSRGGAVGVGEAVLAAKKRYFLEAPSFDPYDEKSLMQWTLFGLPMYTVDTGLPEGAAATSSFGEPVRAARSTVETFGPVRVERRLEAGTTAGTTRNTPPPFLTRLQLHFDLNALGVYTKYNASGEVLEGVAGCPTPPPGEPEGCYYTLNGLVERSTGVTDLPIQPYLIYDSRLAGTSQHGVLWMGGEYDEESDWVAVVAELVSNGGDSSGKGVEPRIARMKPKSRRVFKGREPPLCRTNDLEVNSLVVTAGEALKNAMDGADWSRQRLYRDLDLEIFYFNNTTDSSQNCDRSGPQLLPGPFAGDYHQVSATTVEWAIPAADDAGVWRVVVVYSDGSLDGDGRGRWIPLDLVEDAGVWRGSFTLAGPARLTYVVQTVDRRGNVSWLDFTTTDLPASGVPLDLPEPVDVDVALGTADLSIMLTDAPDPVQTESPLTYTIEVANQGPDPASSVVVSDALPAVSMLVLAWGEGWSCAWAGDLTCSRAFLDVGETAPPITVLTTTPFAVGSLANAVFVTAAQHDPTLANNTSSEATEVTHDYIAVNQVSNSDFDENLDGWLLSIPPLAEMTHSTEDVRGAATSGSLRVTNLGGAEPAAVSQCVAGHPGEQVAFGGAMKINSPALGEPQVYALMEAFSTTDCSGYPIASVFTASLDGDTGGSWKWLPVGSLEEPAETGSVLLSVVVQAGTSNDFEVLLDSLFMYPMLFVDGFESGDTGSWSAKEP